MNLKKSQLCAIVDKIIEGNKNTDGQSLLVVTSCEVRKEAYEDFDTYAKVKGFSKVEIWGESILTSKLHQEKYLFFQFRCCFINSFFQTFFEENDFV